MAQIGRSVSRVLKENVCNPRSPIRALSQGNTNRTKASNAKQKPQAFTREEDQKVKKRGEAGKSQSVTSQRTSGGKRWLHYNQQDKPTAASIRERNITVSSYYNQTAIDSAAEKVE